MKKILTDNMHILVIIGIALGAWALWRTYQISPVKNNNQNPEKKDEPATEE